MKGPRPPVNGTVRMFLQDDCAQGEATKGSVRKHTRILPHTSGAHEYASAPVPVICTVLIKPEQVDRRPARTFLSSPTCSGHSRHVN